MPPAAYHKKNSRRVWASNEQFNVMPILKQKTNYPKGGPIKKNNNKFWSGKGGIFVRNIPSLGETRCNG